MLHDKDQLKDVSLGTEESCQNPQREEKKTRAADTQNSSIMALW